MPYILLFLIITGTAMGLKVRVDYRYDTNGFFNNPLAREAMEAVAARWSRVIDQELREVVSIDDDTDRRFLLTNPSTGLNMEISSAASASTDALVSAGAPVAQEYRNGIFLPADVWIVYAGARSQASLAAGGPFGGGSNFEDVFDDVHGILNRGFNVGFGSLTVLGGSISFDIDENWHFDLRNPSPLGKVDFYSIALHEMGHCFGLAATGVNEWNSLIDGLNYTGEHAVLAYQLESGSTQSTLPIAGPGSRFDYHWRDLGIKSGIFSLGGPNCVGTLGLGVPQDLLMGSTAGFTADIRRFELTNVDVAAMKDIGWSVISEEPQAIPTISLSLARTTAGQWMLTFGSVDGQHYSIQTSLDGCLWSNVTPKILGTGGLLTWTSGNGAYFDPNGISGATTAGLFRVVED